MRYKSCTFIENFYLNIFGCIDKRKGVKMAFCCEEYDGVPGTAIAGSAEQIADNFKKLRTDIIEESMKLSFTGDSDGERKFAEGCMKCSLFQEGEYGHSDGLIHSVNFALQTAPCQCRCIYCNIPRNPIFFYDEERHAGFYEKVFELLERIQKMGLIAHDANWVWTSGEIAIHPFKSRFFDLVKDKTALFYTNGFIFDEGIAANLKANPNSAINLSIDCGTAETWRKVKGFNNFDKVISNLKQYRNSGTAPGQIQLNYIVLPGINDSPEDYAALIDIMKTLGVKHLFVSQDLIIKHKRDEKQKEELIRAAGMLAAMLQKNEITMDLSYYTPAERESIFTLARETL